MFARWPSLFIQASITAWASAWPRAMFSPPSPSTPAAAARSQGVAPSGSVWPKKSRAAMSSLKSWASAVSDALAVTGLQPTFERSWLTRASTAACAEVEAGPDGEVVARVGEADGAFVAVGALVAGADDAVLVGFEAGAFVRSAFFAACFDALTEGLAPGFLLGVADGGFEGVPERAAPLPASADAVADALPVGSADASPWVSRSGPLPARTWSAACPPLTL